jgi:hypothetical protein
LKLTDPNIILKETMSYMEEFKEVNQIQTHGANRVNNNVEIKWKVPLLGWSKANWDASLDKTGGKMGIGVVVRDEMGYVIDAVSKTRQGFFEPVMGEKIAQYQAAVTCKEMGIQKVWLEGEAKIIVDALHSDESMLSCYGHLVEDTKSILKNFLSWKCGFVHREANEVAHRLAKASTIPINDRVWTNHTPDCISEIILMERTAQSL